MTVRQAGECQKIMWGWILVWIVVGLAIGFLISAFLFPEDIQISPIMW